MAVELGAGYLSVLPSTRGFAALLRRELNGPMEAAGADAGESVEKGMSSKAKVIGAGIGLAIGAAATKALTGAMDSEAATKKLGAQLGASARDTKKYGKLAGKLYAQGYGEDLAGVGDAIGRVVKDIPGMDRASAKSLGAITKQVQSVSSTFDQDLGGTTAAVGQLIRTGLVKDAQSGLDLVTKGLQGPANKADDLLETFNEYGTQFRKIGLDGPTALGLLNQAVRAGARDSDVAADALKEFSIRSLESLEKLDSKGNLQLTDLGQAFTDVLPDGADMYAVQEKLAKGGPGAAKAFGQMVAGLKAIDDPALKARASTALFGTQAEDMGAALYAFDPSTAVSGLGKIDGASKKVDASTSTASNSITVFTRSLQQKLTEAGLKVLPTLVNVGNTLSDVFGPALDKHAGLLTKVGLGLAAVAVAAKGVSLIASPLKGLYTGGKTAIDTVGKLREGYSKFAAPGGGLDTVRLRAGQAGDGLKSIGGKAKSGLTTAGSAIRTGASATLGLARSAATSTAAWTSNTIAAGRNRAAIIGQSIAAKASALATRTMAIAQRVLNAAMRANPIGIVITVLAALAAAVVIAYKRSATFRTVVQGAFAGIRKAISIAWSGIRVIFVAYRTYLTKFLFPAIRGLYNNAVRPIFTSVGSKISGVWKNVVSPAFSALRTGVGKVADAFSTGVSAVGTAWDKIKEKTKSPIRAVIGFINTGFIDPFNTVSGKLKGPKIGRLSLPKGFATGGHVSGPGGPTSDSILARLSNNEFVVRARQALKFRPVLEAINAGRVSPKGLLEAVEHRFAGGGFVNPSGRTSLDGKAVSRIAKAQILLAQKLSGIQMRVMQGGFGGSHIAASGSSHNYPGVVDLAPGSIRQETWLRRVGFAAWARNVAGRSSVGSGAHNHAVSLLDPADKRSPQVYGSWANHGNGLSGANNDPAPHPPLLPNLLQQLKATNLSVIGGGGGVTSLLGSLNPVSLFRDAYSKVKAGIGDLANDGIVGQFVSGVVKKLRGAVPEFAKGLASKVAEFSGLGLGKKLLDKVGLFDSGGILAPGAAALNLSGKPEAVFNERQWGIISRAIRPDPTAAVRSGGEGTTVNLNGPIHTTDVDGMVRKLEKRQRRAVQMARAN